MRDHHKSSRRSFLKKAGLATMAAPLMSFNPTHGGASHINPSNQDFDFSFLTDIHIRPDRDAPDGWITRMFHSLSHCRNHGFARMMGLHGCFTAYTLSESRICTDDGITRM